MIFKNGTSGEVIAENMNAADTFLKRLKGLMFTKELSPQSGLYIYPCSGVHTYFMNYGIDVLYLDSNNIILAIDEDMKPSRVGRFVKNAVAVVELSSGRAKQTHTEIGQAVEFIEKEVNINSM